MIKITSCHDGYQLASQENLLMLKHCGEPSWFTKGGSVYVQVGMIQCLCDILVKIESIMSCLCISFENHF